MSEESGPRPATPGSTGSITGRPWYIGGLLIGSALVLGGLQQEKDAPYVETRLPTITLTSGIAPEPTPQPAVEHKPWFVGAIAHGDIFESALDSPEIGASHIADTIETDAYSVDAFVDTSVDARADTDTDTNVPAAADRINLIDVDATSHAEAITPGSSLRVPAHQPQTAAELLSELASDSAPVGMEEDAASDAVDVPSTYHLVIQPGDTLNQRFARLGVPSAELAALIGTPHAKELLTRLHSGEVLLLTINPDASVDRVEYRARDGRTLTINRTGNRFESALEQPVSAPEEFRLAEGQIQNSFYIAAREAGLSNSLRSQFTRMLGSQINFGRQIQAGDRFRVLYRQQSDNRGNSKDRIVAAELSNRGKVYRAVRYTTSDGRSGNFMPNGESLDGGGFLRYPLAYKRVSSGFSKRRWHPKLNRVRAHLGVDFAAAMGTSVKAPAAGKVVFAGVKRGYGNVLELDHGGGIKTVYAHLSRFARGMRKGSKISQGAVIAYVGKSGLATGPHLHYEFHKNGKAVNPLKVRLPNGPVIAKQESKAFKAFVEDALAQLKGEPGTIALAVADNTNSADKQL